jgi:hypothetical protein
VVLVLVRTSIKVKGTDLEVFHWHELKSFIVTVPILLVENCYDDGENHDAKYVIVYLLLASQYKVR